ncbi:hypothetical protein GCK32_017463 [Trichostrongylus colubriformis]|uniref:Uncharacterized protein n=1 Tax=Trichostrongylus colubriformis TaxID=6319 RepID=A0AAN8FNZ8_TRICO
MLSFQGLLCADRDPFKCDKDGKCAPGLRCDHGTCVLRTDCPMLSMPRMKSGCVMLTTVDERGCPMPKIVCSKENLKCGSIYCEPGFECDHDKTVCIPRRDCPNIALPKKEGCTDKMALDEYDCLVPVRNCKSPKPLRAKRQQTSTTEKPNNGWCIFLDHGKDGCGWV